MGKATRSGASHGSERIVPRRRETVDLQLVGSGSDLVVDGDLTVAGTLAVPNPVASDSSVATRAEVKDLIDAEPVLGGAGILYVGTLNPISPLAVIENSTDEANLINPSPYTLPIVAAPGSTLRAFFSGTVKNASGAPTTISFRTIWGVGASAQLLDTVTLASDATARPFTYVIEGGYNVSLAPGFYPSSRLEVGAQGADARQVSIDTGVINLNATPPPLSLSFTAQWGVAHADAEVKIQAGNVQYSVPV